MMASGEIGARTMIFLEIIIWWLEEDFTLQNGFKGVMLGFQSIVLTQQKI